jgi:hypothetical protein
MRRSAVVAGFAVAAFAVMLTGCGSATVDGMTAADVVAKSSDAMNTVRSAAVNGKVQATVNGDKDKASDPATAFLLGAPLTMTVDGVVSEDPPAMDITMTIPLLSMLSPGADTVEERVIGDSVYVRLRDQWYGMKRPKTQPEPSSSPSVSTEQVLDALKGMGVDLNGWVEEKQDLTAGRFEGRDVYLVSEEVDIDAMASGLAKLLGNAAALQQFVPTGQQQATQQQLDVLKSESGRVADGIRKYLKQATLDLVIEKETLHLDKLTLAAAIELSPEAAEKGMSGVDLVVTLRFSDFNQPVTVEKPENVKPFTQALPGVSQGTSGALLPVQSLDL